MREACEAPCHTPGSAQYTFKPPRADPALLAHRVLLPVCLPACCPLPLPCAGAAEEGGAAQGQGLRVQVSDRPAAAAAAETAGAGAAAGRGQGKEEPEQKGRGREEGPLLRERVQAVWRWAVWRRPLMRGCGCKRGSRLGCRKVALRAGRSARAKSAGLQECMALWLCLLITELGSDGRWRGLVSGYGQGYPVCIWGTAVCHSARCGVQRRLSSGQGGSQRHSWADSGRIQRPLGV